jgi:ABC-2 type transport system permease protein
MRKYISYFRVNFIAQLQYRAAAWAGIVTQFFWGFMQLMVYKAFYDSSTAPLPMPWAQVVCYIWVRQAFFILVSESTSFQSITKNATDGGLAYELCRPLDLYTSWSVHMASTRISATLLRFAPILVIASILPASYRISPPASAISGVLFLLSIMLGMLIINNFYIFVLIIGSRTLSTRGPRELIMFTCAFLMGAEIPLPFMPDAFIRILNYLPFRYINDLPLRIYSGNIAPADALPQIALQIFWIIILTAIGKFALAKSMRRIVLQGG